MITLRTTTAKTMNIKIGDLIKKTLSDRKMKLKDFAEELGMARQNIYRIFEKNSIETDLLIKISTVLNHNFFQYLDNQTLGIANGYHHVAAHAKSPGLEVELEACQNELRLAKKEIDYLKKIIELLEERTKWLASQQQAVPKD